MKKRSLIMMVSTMVVVLLLSASVLAQRPAGPPSGSPARAALGPALDTSGDPEQEAADEMNRILRSLRVIQAFFGIPEEVLEDIVAETYDKMLSLLREKHELVLILRDLLNQKNPPPGEVGQLIVDIRQLQYEINTISQEWGNAIEAVLDEEQAEKLAMVRRVAGIIPFFRQVGLIPPPPPRVRAEDN